MRRDFHPLGDPQTYHPILDRNLNVRKKIAQRFIAPGAQGLESVTFPPGPQHQRTLYPRSIDHLLLGGLCPLKRCEVFPPARDLLRSHIKYFQSMFIYITQISGIEPIIL